MQRQCQRLKIMSVIIIILMRGLWLLLFMRLSLISLKAQQMQQEQQQIKGINGAKKIIFKDQSAKQRYLFIQKEDLSFEKFKSFGQDQILCDMGLTKRSFVVSISQTNKTITKFDLNKKTKPEISSKDIDIKNGVVKGCYYLGFTLSVFIQINGQLYLSRPKQRLLIKQIKIIQPYRIKMDDIGQTILLVYSNRTQIFKLQNSIFKMQQQIRISTQTLSNQNKLQTFIDVFINDNGNQLIAIKNVQREQENNQQTLIHSEKYIDIYLLKQEKFKSVQVLKYQQILYFSYIQNKAFVLSTKNQTYLYRKNQNPQETRQIRQNQPNMFKQNYTIYLQLGHNQTKKTSQYLLDQLKIIYKKNNCADSNYPKNCLCDAHTKQCVQCLNGFQFSQNSPFCYCKYNTIQEVCTPNIQLPPENQQKNNRQIFLGFGVFGVITCTLLSILFIWMILRYRKRIQEQKKRLRYIQQNGIQLDISKLTLHCSACNRNFLFQKVFKCLHCPVQHFFHLNCTNYSQDSRSLTCVKCQTTAFSADNQQNTNQFVNHNRNTRLMCECKFK